MGAVAPAQRRARGWARLVHGTSLLMAEIEAFALPMRCPGCGDDLDPKQALCAVCTAAVPRVEGALCVRCLAAGRDAPGCLREPGFVAFPAWIYDERASFAVHALKFGGRRAVASDLGRAIANALPSAYRPELVLEVPLHPARKRERGYDQSALLAEATARAIGSPRLGGALRRDRPTRPQTRLGPAARRRNVAGAIRVTDPRALQGRSVLVVDDVITTGSTMEACLHALASCGARAMGAALAWAP